jgi:hypothetical protein
LVSQVDTVSTWSLIDKPLSADQIWYWRVRDADGDTRLWSTAAEFTVKL